MLGKRPCRATANAIVLLLILGGVTPATAEEYTLKSGRAPGETSQVEILLEVGGDLSLVDEKDKKVHRLKTSVVGTMVYDERLAGVTENNAELRGMRHYRRSDAVIKIDKGTTKTRLRDDRRLIAVAVDSRKATLFCPDGPLRQEELDLIQIPACSLVVERLLPERAVSPADQWQHPEDVLVALLNLDAVSENEVTNTFKEVTENAAQLELAGTVQGAIDGVATELELKGRYKFDLATQRITWFALLVKEKRRIGHVAPGVDFTARLQMKVAPGKTNPALTDEALADKPLDPSPELTLLEYVSPEGQYQFLHDRAWHVVNEAPKTVALRLLDRGELLAQCNVSTVPTVSSGQRFTLEKFQDDVKQSLGKHFERFISAGESANSVGHNTCRVVAAGTVEGLAIQWNYYLVADQRGRQTVLAFTVESELLDRFGTSDQPLLASLRFAEQGADSAAQIKTAGQRK